PPWRCPGPCAEASPESRLCLIERFIPRHLPPILTRGTPTGIRISRKGRTCRPRPRRPVLPTAAVVPGVREVWVREAGPAPCAGRRAKAHVFLWRTRHRSVKITGKPPARSRPPCLRGPANVVVRQDPGVLQHP